MILFLLLHNWEGRKLKALFYLGLTNLCNVRFVGKKYLHDCKHTIASLRPCAQITEYIISSHPHNKCV